MLSCLDVDIQHEEALKGASFLHVFLQTEIIASCQKLLMKLFVQNIVLEKMTLSGRTI